MNIRGGVDPDVARAERGGGRPSAPHAATIVKVKDDRARLHLVRPWNVEVGERIILSSETETFAVEVYAVHAAHLLVDVKNYEPLIAGAKHVTLRRAR